MAGSNCYIFDFLVPFVPRYFPFAQLFDILTLLKLPLFCINTLLATMKFLSALAIAAALHTQAIILSSAQSSGTNDLAPPSLPSPKPPVEFALTLQRDASEVKGLSIPHVGGSFWGFSIDMLAINELGTPMINLFGVISED